MLTKNQLKDIFACYGFAPLKRLGENYLIDGNIRDKIVSAVGASRGDTVLEIGPGLGALTIDLAGTGARVIAVEKDKKACAALKDLAGGALPNLEIVNADILKFDLAGAAGPKKVKVAGNLPYYITTPVVEYILRNREAIDLAVIMVQKEVASRFLAVAGSEDYSSLSCFVQYHARPKHIYTVKRTCFYPAPEVDSAIVKLEIMDKPTVKVKDEDLLFRIIRGAFNQRRKSVINSLSREAVLDIPKKELAAILDRAGIDPATRPETLSLADFAKLTNAVECDNL
ncbi:MAG: 16S rRNA (adenine(1518)-N(6)/adenine(1519)-N(6))-dimethyltransferase RsmA [Candidatus Omnitrophica bacterium]|nr:16S rRNA (adenine(1518)-N(6)/adenine(1519)-N(6))-dimethyltransferase RsmA [Candidatus Omnitrophota bacterium]MDD5436497.1 16S rRNA (adenine(1518)-N(6)/adenine(1519)-N(6))-dimethyltransferase RsmA [Candidatus Omnitrophota bacterium]